MIPDLSKEDMARSAAYVDHRFVHASGRIHGPSRTAEVVRYERDGQWCLEFERGSLLPYRKLRLGEAVRYALQMFANGGEINFGLPHGARFDAAALKALSE